MFFRQPPNSTPAVSSLVYTRSVGPLNAACTCPTNASRRTARQVVGIFMRGRKRERLLEAPRHERDRVAEPCEMRRESRASGAGANDRKIHARFLRSIKYQVASIKKVCGFAATLKILVLV